MNQEKEPQEKDLQENDPQKEELQEKQPAVPQREEPQEQPEKKSSVFRSTKFKHGSVSTAFIAGFIAVVVLLNVLVGILSDRFPSINLDLTKNGTNSLSAESVKVIDQVKIPAEIYILATKQQTENDSVMSGYSQVGSLSAKIAERNPNIKVEYIDLDKNPTFASEYAKDNLTAGDVIVKTSKRYRVLTTSDLFQTQYGSNYSSQQVYSNVDGSLASALNAVISEKLPVVAFDTGHSEKQDMSAYKKLLENNCFQTKDFNLLTDKIPDGAQMIVLGTPTTDYTDDEIKKLGDFLGSKTLGADRSLMITFYPTQGDMPRLGNFLAEWGIQVQKAVVVESDAQRYFAQNASNILSDIQNSLSLTSKAEQAQQQGQTTSSDYGYFITPQSAPINLTFTTKGARTTYSLAKSAKTSYLVTNSTKSTDNPEKAAYNTAALSQEYISAGGNKNYKASVIAVGSQMIFSEGIINESTFGDGKYMLDLSKYATGTNDTATDVTIMPKEMNTSDITAKSAMANFLGLGIFTLLIPLAIAAAGIVVHHKRRHL